MIGKDQMWMQFVPSRGHPRIALAAQYGTTLPRRRDLSVRFTAEGHVFKMRLNDGWWQQLIEITHY